MRCALAVVGWLALIVGVRADDPDVRAGVAQMAFLAQLAPKACPSLRTNVVAVAAFMANAHINERELFDSYGSATRIAADAFRESFSRDPEAACSQVWDVLGDDGLGLLAETDDGEK